MSRLDDIAHSHSLGLFMTNEDGDFVPVDADGLARLLKKDLSALMWELIGNLELFEENTPGHNIDVGARNGLRLELRQKVNDL